MIWRSAFSLLSRDRLSILIFHRVLRVRDPILSTEPCADDFEALLQRLQARFTILPLADAVTRLYDGSLPAGALAITFDDGYADNLEVAAPILRKLRIPATVFIATRYLDGGSMWNDAVIEAFRSTRNAAMDLTALDLGMHTMASLADRRAAIDRVLAELKYLAPTERERRAHAISRIAGVPQPDGIMLTRNSLRSLVDAGLEIGAHTVNHPILASVSAAEAWREISESKRDLEQTLGRAVTLFAYPNGKPGKDYAVEHVRMVREAGYVAAVSTAHGAASPQSDTLQLPRFTPWTRQHPKFDLLMLRNLCQGMEARAA